MEQIYDYTIKLIRYVLNGDVPKLPDDIDFERLFAFGKSHGVENMLYIGMRDLQIAVPEDTMKKFKKAYEMAIMLEAKQAFELESIGEAFEEAGIDYIPLKGSVVKYLYPMPDYRKSGDIDILVHPEDEERTRPIIEKLGYTYNYIFEGHEAHAEYEKRPHMFLEIHRKLVSEQNRAYQFSTYVWNYATPHVGFRHQYELDINFLYVYLIAHIAKHLSEGGAGIKLIADIWLIKNSGTLKREKLNELLELANLIDIERYLEEIIDKWFKGKACNAPMILTLEKYIFEGGSFGTAVQRMTMKANEYKNQQAFVLKYKLKNILKDIFEPYSYMKQKYPILRKHSFLLPVMWIYRGITVPFTQSKKVKAKLYGYANDKINKKADLSKIYEAVKLLPRKQ